MLAACMEKDYQEILIDFGKVREEIFPEWLRCTKKSPGRRPVRMEAGSISGIVDRERGKLQKEWICMTAFGGEIMKQEIERQFHYFLKTESHFQQMPFSVDVQTMEWFADIFK